MLGIGRRARTHRTRPGARHDRTRRPWRASSGATGRRRPPTESRTQLARATAVSAAPPASSTGVPVFASTAAARPSPRRSRRSRVPRDSAVVPRDWRALGQLLAEPGEADPGPPVHPLARPPDGGQGAGQPRRPQPQVGAHVAQQVVRGAVQPARPGDRRQAPVGHGVPVRVVAEGRPRGLLGRPGEDGVAQPERLRDAALHERAVARPARVRERDAEDAGAEVRVLEAAARGAPQPRRCERPPDVREREVRVRVARVEAGAAAPCRAAGPAAPTSPWRGARA